MAKASQVERQARVLCVELARVTRGRPMHWCTVDSIMAAAGVADPAADAAVAFAVGRGWLLEEGQPPHSICLTEGGRVMVANMKPR
jgi:hypothetical protein